MQKPSKVSAHVYKLHLHKAWVCVVVLVLWVSVVIYIVRSMYTIFL